MAAYQHGEAEAFNQLYARYRGPLYRYFLRQVDRSVAEELYQESFMQVVRAGESYRTDARFASWLFRIAHNRLIDFYRRRGVRPEQNDETAIDNAANREPTPDAALEQHQSASELKQAVAALPSQQRDAFLLKEEGGLSLLEIAAVTGASRETIKSRLRYAVGKLRLSLGVPA